MMAKCVPSIRRCYSLSMAERSLHTCCSTPNDRTSRSSILIVIAFNSQSHCQQVPVVPPLWQVEVAEANEKLDEVGLLCFFLCLSGAQTRREYDVELNKIDVVFHIADYFSYSDRVLVPVW